jgi:hypothetical protein
VLPPSYSSPYYDPRALFVGGLGSFLSSSTFTGFAVLHPLLLMDPSWGIVSDSGEGEISPSDTQKVALTLGYILALIGVVGVLSQMICFAFLTKSIGLFFTTAIGNALQGICFCLLLVVSSVPTAIPLYVGFAFGNGISKSCYSIYLGSIAHKTQTAQYVSVAASGGTIAMAVSAQLTLLYVASKPAAFLLAGFLSILNFFMFVGLGIVEWRKSKAVAKEKEREAAKETVEPKVSPLVAFFGQGQDEEAFWQDLRASLVPVIEARRWGRAYTLGKCASVFRSSYTSIDYYRWS